MSGLSQRKRSHTQPCEAPGSRVTGAVGNRSRRPSQDELAGVATPVDGVPDVVPDVGLDLPLIDEPRCVAFEQQIGIDVEQTQGIRVCIKSEEHTSELQSRGHLVCRLLLEKKML